LTSVDGSKVWAGSNGLDSVLIAYDCFLACDGDWKKLCFMAMLHGGDNDSTGCTFINSYFLCFYLI
jgi:hypothetical protein